MTRCFLGFEFTPDSLAYLKEQVLPVHRRLAEELGWPLRLVRPENWHVTLLFFDALEPEERAAAWKAVEQGARSGAWRELGFVWRGLALWPSPRRPSLLCLEGEVFPGAAAWPLPVAEAPFSKGDLRHYGAFRPHATLMRLTRRGRKPLAREWRAFASELPAFDSAHIRFDRVAFFLSTLSEEQPFYVRERTVELTGL